MRGTESEVAGMISATSSMKTVSDSSTVIPDEEKQGLGKEIRSEFSDCLEMIRTADQFLVRTFCSPNERKQESK